MNPRAAAVKSGDGVLDAAQSEGKMELGEQAAANLRSSIREQLELLADPAAQREYERNVPVARVAAELLCGWFDDLYHPESPTFQAAFSPQELDALADFNDVFSAAGAEIPDPLPQLAALQTSPAWSRVTSGAAKALHRVFGLEGQAGS
jgi:hypothetical protein